MHTADQKLKWHVFVLIALMLVLGFAHEWVNPWLRYDREAIEAGQIWRLVSCHLVHLNQWHMLMNLSGFFMCWFFFTDLLTRKILWLWFCLSSVAVGLAFFYIDTDLQWYVGLSGILHGFLIMCLIIGWRGNRWLHSIVLTLICARLIWEHTPGYDVNYLQSFIKGRVYVNAHLYGSIMGALIGLGLCLKKLGLCQNKTQKNKKDISV